jgi:hypothetical protein
MMASADILSSISKYEYMLSTFKKFATTMVLIFKRDRVESMLVTAIALFIFLGSLLGVFRTFRQDSA